MSFIRDDSKEILEGGEVFGIKPMNCPNAMVVFGSKSRSYRELPLRLSDTDTLHRYERSGTLNGLLRAREFCQDDAHIFVTENQIAEEFERLFEVTEKFYSIFGLDYRFRLGTRPESFVGEIETWNKAEETLATAPQENETAEKSIEAARQYTKPKTFCPLYPFFLQDEKEKNRLCELRKAALDKSKSMKLKARAKNFQKRRRSTRDQEPAKPVADFQLRI
jgi:threonyl-tRNA synthetase